LQKTVFLFLIILACLATDMARAESPYEKIIPADYAVYGVSLIAGAGSLYLGARMNSLSETQISRLDRTDVNRFDRGATFNYSKTAATISDWGMHACLILPGTLILDGRMREDAATIALLYFETMALAGATTELAKTSFRRIRPYAYNPDVPIESKKTLDTRKSFFSGHTSTSFASALFFAKVFGDYYPDSRWKPWVWAGAISVASTVACSRVAAGKHFPTDVLAGALIGSLAGYLVPKMHEKRGAKAAFHIESQSLPMAFSFRVTW